MYFLEWIQGAPLHAGNSSCKPGFKDKPGGLITNYVAFLYDLKSAMANYTRSGGRGSPTDYKDEAVALMLEKYEIVKDLFYGFDYIRTYALEVQNQEQ